MTLEELLQLLRQCQLVASVQASHAGLREARALALMAAASADQGVRLLRLEGVESIRAARERTGLPVIGLIKREYPDSQVYITPTLAEVEALLESGCEIIALDATGRSRPREDLATLVRRVHEGGALVLGDIDSQESAAYAESCGVDLLSTTLGGYTAARPSTEGPDFELLRQVAALAKVPVLAEGRFEEPWQVAAALRIGASGVVIGGALNDPAKNTRRFMPPPRVSGNVGAVDIGGTWLRYGLFSPDWQLLDSIRVLNPSDRRERIDWIRSQVGAAPVERVGVSTGGIVDPRTGEVWTAKEYLMPDHTGIRFDEATLGVPAYAHGDGHATAWGHACRPEYAGLRVATLALGTGVGCGFVADGRIWAGRRGEYPRINDLPAPGGRSYEDLLGGINLTSQPSPEQQQMAREALYGAAAALRGLYFPDRIIIGGSVGLSDWMADGLQELGLEASPFGPDAGLYGAAAVALFPARA